jgi:hypothetical protein
MNLISLIQRVVVLELLGWVKWIVEIHLLLMPLLDGMRLWMQ